MIQTPALTVDIIIEYRQKIVLIRRKNDPFKGNYALPGGFVEVGETMEAAAIREAKEETGLDIEIGNLVGIYSDPGRDPRGHTVSACYLAAGSGTLAAGTDAADAVLFAPDQIPKLAFDHDRMIADAFLRFTVRKIGVVRSSVKDFIPGDRWGAVVSEVVLETQYTNALDGLDEFSHAVIVFFLHRVTGEVQMKTHPMGRADMPYIGIFALCTPRRPNPIGITVVEILERDRNRLVVRGLDAIEGTPVLDVKPYMPPGDASVPEWVGRMRGGR
ncbi:MAG: tRNA (N6-threonylcarbamoyladenosine(37)-N6)-methyltransferase TrmO [Euryarchaeota archaeon]|nr:tRNA (N6-threonylcarbamoyladenosine(37)-N6)-methyltransferase TrmO [Euryarchaeota archaeon]